MKTCKKIKTDAIMTCPHCGHKDTRAYFDPLPRMGVRRADGHNAVCHKCKEPIPYTIEPL
jgi:hypothetical protein